MRSLATTLQVFSTLLIIPGLWNTGSLVVICTVPGADMQSQVVTLLMIYAPLLLLLVGAVCTFREFHALRWPANLVGSVGMLQTLAALMLFTAGKVESARTPQGPLDTIGGAIMTILSYYAFSGAGALMLGAFLSNASHQYETPVD